MKNTPFFNYVIFKYSFLYLFSLLISQAKSKTETEKTKEFCKFPDILCFCNFLCKIWFVNPGMN